MEWQRKSRLDVSMALVAEARLLCFEHRRLRFKFVAAVATGATDESLAMGGPLKVRMLTSMAGQALRIHLLCCCLFELKDLGRDAAAFDMRLAGAVAAFACHTFAAMLECQIGMRIILEALHFVLMASGTGFCPDVISHTHCRFWRRNCGLGLGPTGGLRKTSGA